MVGGAMEAACCMQRWGDVARSLLGNGRMITQEGMFISIFQLPWEQVVLKIVLLQQVDHTSIARGRGPHLTLRRTMMDNI